MKRLWTIFGLAAALAALPLAAQRGGMRAGGMGMGRPSTGMGGMQDSMSGVERTRMGTSDTGQRGWMGSASRNDNNNNIGGSQKTKRTKQKVRRGTQGNPVR